MLKQAVKNFRKESRFGLVLDWGFHKRNAWVSAYAPFLVNEMLRQFDPVIISSQWQYDLHKRKLDYLFSFEPGFASPAIAYDRRVDATKCVLYSDPHFQPEKRQRYFTDNGFDFLFSFYRAPFFQHFKGFPEEKFVHFPWAVPDSFISDHEPTVRSSEIAIFGGKNSDAYDVRNWCREQPCVTNYEFSGVENKKLDDEEYYLWLRRFDAIVAAGSSHPIYNMVTPKYFEIASSGALLIGQHCDDLETLGFDNSNAMIFRREDFLEKVDHYRKHPDDFLSVREKGRALIRNRHRLSVRMETIKRIFGIESVSGEASNSEPRTLG